MEGEGEGRGVLEVGSPTIKPINKGAIHRICSGQVILDLSSAVKELVENSLDAGATIIEISMKEYGLDWFKVIDNGSGISPNNFKALALKHHTSKIADFPDLQSLATFGFRGEALSSLCALGNVTVETRTELESMATHLTFDHSGLLTGEKKTARQVGTTVTVEKLFSPLPVRSKEFSRNIRREYGKLISLLNAYALIAKGVRLVCTNTTGKNAKSVVLKTQGSSSIKDNIITVFGMNTFSCLEPLDICISESWTVEGYLSKPGHGSGRTLGDRQFYFVNGRPVDMPKITKLVNELYKSSNSRQYPIAIMNFTVPGKAYDVNVTPDKRKIFFSDEGSLMKSLREAIEKIYSPSQCSYPVNKLEENASLEMCLYPEKAQEPLLLEGCGNKEEESDGEQAVVQQIEEADTPEKGKKRARYMSATEGFVLKLESDPPHKDFSLKAHSIGKVDGSYAYKSDRSKIPTPNAGKAYSSQPQLRAVRTEAKSLHSSNRSSLVQSSLTKFICASKRKHENSSSLLSEVPILRNESDHCQILKISSEVHTEVSRSLVDHNHSTSSGDVDEFGASKCPTEAHAINEVDSPPSAGCDVINGGCGEDNPKQQKQTLLVVDADPVPDKDPESISQIITGTDTYEVTWDTPSVRASGLDICPVLQFSMKELVMNRKKLSTLRSSGFNYKERKIKRCFTAATLELSQPENEERKAKALAAATTELERFFSKEDFCKMKVIGQFNLGFIIGRLDQDLFIIDQHAADEKHNFERLSESTVLNQQPLLRPLRLELSPEEEIVAAMHMDIIRRNGFTLVEDVNAPPGHRFKLGAVPFSKNITFGGQDVKELISALSDTQGECTLVNTYKMDTADSICPPRVRAMLASRACRSSIMIGDALDKNEMQKVVEHLASLRSPWNCPHGRPTMRHLIDMTTIESRQVVE